MQVFGPTSNIILVPQEQFGGRQLSNKYAIQNSMQIKLITPRISPNQISPDQISPAKLAQTQISLNPNQPLPKLAQTQISPRPKLAQDPNQPRTQISPIPKLAQDPYQSKIQISSKIQRLVVIWKIYAQYLLSRYLGEYSNLWQL